MHKIKFENYLLLSTTEDKREYSEIFKAKAVYFLDYFKYLLDDNFNDFKNYLLESLDLTTIKNASDYSIIKYILPVTLQDRNKKYNSKKFYEHNAICVYNIIRSIYTKDLYNKLLNNPNITELHNYCHILRSMLLDVSDLINLYNNYIKKDLQYIGFGQRKVHNIPIHQQLRQVLYGQISSHSFADLESNVSIVLIRQLIELRLRRAFGAEAFIDESGDLYPLDLSKIFYVLKKKSGIVYSVNIDAVHRIYKWANSFVHSGYRDFSWIPFYLEQYLQDFTFGIATNNPRDINNGVQLSADCLKEIQLDLLSFAPKDKNCSLYSASPSLECVIKP